MEKAYRSIDGGQDSAFDNGGIGARVHESVNVVNT